jgi:2-oxoglutarate dehydrogenase E1 component
MHDTGKAATVATMDLDSVLRANPGYIDDLYEQYRRDRSSVGEDWAHFFAGFELGSGDGRAAAKRPQRAVGVFDLIHSYRELGHLIADLDPLAPPPVEHPLLSLDQFGFSDADLDRVLTCPTHDGEVQATLAEAVEVLRATYCGTMSPDYMYIDDAEQRRWLQGEIEPNLNTPVLSDTDRVYILQKLIAATGFEEFLHTKYVGQKRFSLEGGESLIPLLDTLIEISGDLGVSEIVAGMPHRGRLNVMANVLGKPFEMIFSEFEGSFLPADIQGDGDVKYHLGYARDHTTRNDHDVHISLLANPSHLEAVDPVVEGIVRAKQRYLKDADCSRVMPLLLHGDAAFTGQGIVAETLALSELPAYKTGGTIHIIINNRVGFTASPVDYCFTRYPSDVGKFIQAPVFHVNNSDPEAAVQAARIAARYRNRFKADVIVDLVCYRRHGHNEGDDPTFTHPQMYERIAKMKPVRDLYARRLIERGVIGERDFDDMTREQREIFDAAIDYARDFMPKQQVFTLGGAWNGMTWAGDDRSADTRVAHDRLVEIADKARFVPQGFDVHPKAKRLLDERVKMVRSEEPRIDWGCAEMLAIGSLLVEGVNVRLTGQDSGRGTFSHRHAVLTDQSNDATHVPLQHLSDEQGWFTIADSMLSEAAALGFEYGFSSADPRNLVIWEAQFGDFANGAQVAIDQFISSAESKWQRMNGLVMLLPHGYEGQGPEHSSARLERYLQLCGDDNLQVCNLTTPAQYFHALRRQQLRSFRKPLVMMSPKSLLRHPDARSSGRDLSEGAFQTVIGDPSAGSETKRLLLCSGKIYYELLSEREERNRPEVAIVRIEELYPFPAERLGEELSRVPASAEICWVQEEPWNMGAWHFLSLRLPALLGDGRAVRYVGRDEAASPATGSYKQHSREQSEIFDHAFASPHS